MFDKPCNVIRVEGGTEKVLLTKLFENDPRINSKVEALGGKEKVIKEFERLIKGENVPDLENVTICFMVDGDEEGFNGLRNRFANYLDKLEINPPHIIYRLSNPNYTAVLIVLGEEDKDYKGCLESILNKYISFNESEELSSQRERIIDEIFKYFSKKKVNLSFCDKEKIKFYISIFLFSDNPSILYLNKNFVETLFDIVGKSFVLDIIRKFIAGVL